MFLTKYDSFKDLRELEKKIVGSFPSFDEEGGLAGFMPVVNTREGKFAYHVEVDLPGVNKEDITVDVKDNVLSISGERKHREEVKREDYYKLESSYGKFQRSFTLPKGVDSENVKASAENGVLEITIPKLSQEEKKKITVE
jgi:HSP20 family protein